LERRSHSESTPAPERSQTRFSRRAFLLASLAAETLAAHPPQNPASPLKIDYRSLITRADLRYGEPAARSEEGAPVGNGRMGSLVWTTPSALHFQINRVDVYASNSASHSFFERNTDYCGGCGFMDLDFGNLGPEVFPAEGFSQRLSVYDALLKTEGRGVTARTLAWHERDVMAIEIDDQRSEPGPVTISLRMLRYAARNPGPDYEAQVANNAVEIRTRNHTATSQLHIRGGRIVLTQEFREGDYSNKSAVAIAVDGRSAQPSVANEYEVRLSVPAGKHSFICWIASAASFDPAEDVVQRALEHLDAAEAKGFDGLANDNQQWWSQFWSRGFVALRSDDGVADYVEQNYNYFLYLMASSSRGKLPPKFNGMIWNTGGDARAWGSQHWFANLSCYYEALPATNRFELMDPAFAMYSGMYDACATAARQQWGSQGIFIPETTFFNGLAELPEDIAAEMRDLYLLRKPWEQRSEKFMRFAATQQGHSSRWNWIGGGEWVDGHWVIRDKGFGPFGHVSHILGTTAKVAYLFWRRYEYTRDGEWLRTRAYPMLKGASEFYRNHPNVRKDAAGTWHVHNVNSNESVLGARDTDEDLSAIRGLFAAAIRASEILNQDASLRAQWRELLEHLAPLPASDNPDALKPDDYHGPRVWVRGLKPAVKGGFRPDANSLPQWFFDLCTLESPQSALEIARTTFASFFPNGIDAETRVGVLSKLAIAAATLGNADAVRFLIPNQMRVLRQEREQAYRGGSVLANRLTLREGNQAMDAQRLGRASEALHLALLQSNPPGPAEDPVLRVFAAWPKQWDAAFRLLARGAFLVASSIRAGRIGFVEIESLAGGECKLRNPWPEAAVTLFRNGHKSEELQGSLLRFATRRGEKILVVPSGVDPAGLHRAVPV
jgi:Glycosyl hydrolase family 95 catalytic domain